MKAKNLYNQKKNRIRKSIENKWCGWKKCRKNGFLLLVLHKTSERESSYIRHCSACEGFLLIIETGTMSQRPAGNL